MRDFHKHAEEIIDGVDEISDLHVKWFQESYVFLKLMSRMPIFDKAYDVLTERGHYTRSNAFGEMHGDRYLWIEKAGDVKVIIFECQNYRMAYIKDGNAFHIRELYYRYSYPAWRRKELSGITLPKFRRQKFKPHCPNDYEAPRLEAFCYGDNRDAAFILSMESIMAFIHKHQDKLPKGDRVTGKVENCGDRAIQIIRAMDSWESYLDDPSELE